MTGRPSSIRDYVCTTPLPVPFEGEDFQDDAAVQPLQTDMQKSVRAPNSTMRSHSIVLTTSRASFSQSPRTQPDPDWARIVTLHHSQYFLYSIQLAQVTQDVLDRLYTPKVMKQSRSQVLSTIANLDLKVTAWRRHLPSTFDFNSKQRDQTFARQRLKLGLFYYSALIMINRHGLCRHNQNAPHQSKALKDANRKIASRCVEAAQKMLGLISDDSNVVELTNIAPWWCVLHLLMQAAIVLMLELAFGAQHVLEDVGAVLESAKKAVRWFHGMASGNLAARRAWLLCDNFLRSVAPGIGGDVNDLPDSSDSDSPVGGSGLPVSPVDAHSIFRSTSTSSAYGAKSFSRQGEITFPAMYTTYNTAHDEYLTFDPPVGELTEPLFYTNPDWMSWVQGCAFETEANA